MRRYLIVATGGAGGGRQPLVAAALALRSRGHETSFVGDASVDRVLTGLGLDVHILPPEFDLGPRLVAAIREAMATTGGDIVAAGPIVEDRLAGWAREASVPVAEMIGRLPPAAVITSPFGVEVVQEARTMTFLPDRVEVGGTFTSGGSN